MINRELGTVVSHKSDLYTEYDVTDKHYCINEKPRKLIDIFNDVNKQLKEKYPKLCEGFDYFSLSASLDHFYDSGSRGTEILWNMDTAWTAVYYVTGGSEGYYIHVSSIHDDKHKLLFLGKTLREGEAGISWAEQMVAAISRIMNV